MFGKVFLSVCAALLVASCLLLGSRYKNEITSGFYGSDEKLSKTTSSAAVTPYKIGTGIADVTGAAAEWGMMGYAMLNQKTNGIHIRLRSRAYIMQENVDNGKRVVFVSVDICMIQPTLKDIVISALKTKYGDLYDYDNVILSATHTHAGPAGYSQLMLYDVTSLGYSASNQHAITDGIIRSIERAHDNIKNGRIKIATGTVDGANINRSPYSYTFNPDAKDFSFNTDHDMTLLKFEDENGNAMGSVNWFAVHGTSMTNTNGLISGDNKGRASQLFEAEMNGDALPGNGPFVAAFAQTNEGDVSPNTDGAKCLTDGSPCDSVHSLCTGKSGFCVAKGPGANEFQSTEIIASKQFGKAKELFDGATEEITGPIDFRHKWNSMGSTKVSAEYTSTGKDETTCVAALGEGFAGGTTDGPGDFPFEQGDTTINPFWNAIVGILSKPTPEQIFCQSPKPILLNVGSILLKDLINHDWVANVLPLQMARIGDLVIISAPAELTTMSGRRLRQSVYDALKAQNAVTAKTRIVIAGLANSYSHYVTTFEEYQVQRYEGGSTLYGPHTLAAYEQEFSLMAKALATGAPVLDTATRQDFSGMTLSVHPGVVFDTCPIGKNYGDVKNQPSSSYVAGTSTVSVDFWGAHPNNNFKDESTFLTIELNVNGAWQVVATDSSWETKFHWQRSGVSDSIVNISWEIPASASAGQYRISYHGDHKNVFQQISSFTGTSNTFMVTSNVKVVPYAEKRGIRQGSRLGN